MARKLRLRSCDESVLTIDRSRFWTERLVYLLVANRSFHYPNGGRSHIIYIGTTSAGASRPASSAARKASEMFGELRGVKQIGVYIANCDGRRAIKSWRVLESALLHCFRSIYFKLPLKNKKREPRVDVDRYFNEHKLKDFLRQFEKKPRL